MGIDAVVFVDGDEIESLPGNSRFYCPGHERGTFDVYYPLLLDHLEKGRTVYYGGDYSYPLIHDFCFPSCNLSMEMLTFYKRWWDKYECRPWRGEVEVPDEELTSAREEWFKLISHATPSAWNG